MDSYNTILERMLADYRTRSGITPAPESDIMLRLQVLAGEIYKLRVNTEYIRRQLFPTTAQGDYLDAHALERGLTRKPAAKAHGNVTFYRADGNTDSILIPAGTQVGTIRDARRFITQEDATLASGANQILVPVEAAEAGASYNVNGGTITVILTPVAGIGRVYNGSLMRSGADIESDDSLRERLLDSYRNISNGANAAYYRLLAESVTGVYSAGVVGRARGAGTVDVYVCARGGAVSASVLAQVQTLLSQMRELNVDVAARHASVEDINLHIRLKVRDGYAFSDVSAEVRRAVTAYINERGVGGDVLLCDVGEVIFHVEGVASYRFVESYGSDRLISDSAYPAADSILISEV